MIDPDKQGPLRPFRVLCEFDKKNDNAVTVVRVRYPMTMYPSKSTSRDFRFLRILLCSYISSALACNSPTWNLCLYSFIHSLLLSPYLSISLPLFFSLFISLFFSLSFTLSFSLSFSIYICLLLSVSFSLSFSLYVSLFLFFQRLLLNRAALHILLLNPFQHISLSLIFTGGDATPFVLPMCVLRPSFKSFPLVLQNFSLSSVIGRNSTTTTRIPFPRSR